MRQRYLDLDERTDDLKKTVAKLPGGFAAFREVYEISWIFHENGLEGVVLTYPEIKSAVDNKIISDVSLLPTYQYIKNQKACVDLVREKADSKRFNVTIGFLKELHGKLVASAEDVGVYRKDIPIHRTYFHEIAQPAKIHASLQKVLEYMKTRQDKDMHAIELAANVHHRFMRVFPFSDYSGVIGRLIANFLMMRAGYLPVIIHASDRQRYYEALRGPERDFRHFVAEAMENSLENARRFYFGVEAGDDYRRVAT
ncbi:MAG: Fic family protein [Deltaproteobacteria bacterium]|nr:Fic family protein [Deltaproteobacteria bacterium]